jgi:quinol monooxygenase YgiN
MAFVVVATWRAKEGEEERVRGILEALTPLIRAEPGCLQYTVHRSVDDPRTFLLYEQYRDEAAFKAHGGADYVKRYVLDDAVNRLELRQRALYTSLD